MNLLRRLRHAFRSRIFARAMLLNLSAVSALVLLLAAFFVWIGRTEFRGQLRLRAQALAGFAAMESQFAMLVGDDVALQHIASGVLTNEDVLYVVLETKGRPPVIVQRPGIARGAITGPNLSNRKAGSPALNVMSVECDVPAPEGGLMEWDNRGSRFDALGTVRLGVSMDKQDTLYYWSVATGLALAIAALILISALQYFQFRRLLRPIATLGDFARNVGEGDLARRAPVTGEDEVARVAVAFNHMVEKLGASMVSKGYVDNIIQSMAESLIVVDAAGRIETLNQATCSLLGYAPAELIGQPVRDLIGVDGLDRTYRSRDGEEIPVLLSEAGLHGAASRVLVAQDITERKRIQEQLVRAKNEAEAASRSKSLFLANMSHELRTPLNAIIGYAELIEETAADVQDEQTCSDVRKIRSAGLHLRDVINDVLDISKMEAGKLEAAPSHFDLQTLLEDVIDTIRPLASQNRNDVELRLESEACAIFTDQLKFRQSLLNLMSNACKFTHDGKVSLSYSKESCDGSDWLRLEIRDTGLGIAPEKVKKLFQPFYQVDNSLTRKFGGTGLGLAITKNLCELLGGTVEVASTQGVGSVFTIQLPAKLPARAVAVD